MIMIQALLMIGVRASEIRCYPLDERSVYTIQLSRKEPTTCVFPAPIRAIVGANVSASAADNPGILLSHETGTDYFSLRLVKDGATGALNVLLRGRVYVLAFVSADEPDRAVAFFDEPIAGVPLRISPLQTLRGLIQRAKQLDRNESPFPGMSSRFERTQPATTTEYRDFTATIESIVRFEPEDTLVFRIRLENTLDLPVRYDPDNLAIRLGREFFPAALAEASGAIPPKGHSLIYLAIAGAPGGGRANLSVREAFSVIVPRP